MLAQLKLRYAAAKATAARATAGVEGPVQCKPTRGRCRDESLRHIWRQQGYKKNYI
eukprot:COSAG01_NODE_3792_length_5691_cov_11.941166_2_plen_56_part_00